MVVVRETRLGSYEASPGGFSLRLVLWNASKKMVTQTKYVASGR